MYIALLDTCVLWPSLQRDVLLSLAVEHLYRPPAWSSAILDELRFHESRKLVERNLADSPHAADASAKNLIDKMREAFPDAEATGWEGARGNVRTSRS